jgi:hypothetical protein
MGAKRPRSELIKLLAQQRQALAASCQGYDRGDEWEASRLATTAFTLLHDGGSITSLLTQLRLRASLRFLSSGRASNKKNLLSETPPLLSVHMSAGSGTNFRPILGSPSPSGRQQLQFSSWWAKEIIYKDSRAHELTRSRLIFALRHQDGGGHIGDLTDRTYVHLKGGGGWFGNVEAGAPKPIAGAVPATMRQVAWELTETLKQLGEIT